MSDTTTTTAVPQLKFSVPGAITTAPPIDIPPAVDKPIATGLATVAATEDTRQSVVCKEMIAPETLQQAQAAARQLLPAMLKDTDVFMSFGQAALKDVNELIDIMLNQIKSGSMGPIKEIMTQAYLNMRNIKGKYDLSDPKARKAYDEWEHGMVKKLLHRGRNYFEAMRADMMSVDTQLDKLSADLKARYVDIRNTTKLLDQLYDKNEASIYALIQHIAVMELIVDQAREEASQLPDTDPQTGQQNEEKRKRVDLIQQMNVKIGEYKGRLFVAWATSPQLRMMRVMDVGMAEKLNEAINLTVYNIKLAMVEWRAQAQAVEDAKATESLNAAMNESMKEVAAAGASAAEFVMNAVTTPSLLPETISAVTDSLNLMADNIITAIKAGDDRRAELERTMAQSKAALNARQGEFNQQLVDAIVGQSTKPFELPISRPTLALTAG